MRKLRNTSQAPPDFFSFTHSETGHTTKANDYTTWIDKCIEHRRGNNLSIPDNFELVAQDQLCQTLHPDLWEIDSGDKSWVNPRITWGDVYNAANTYHEWRIQGKPFVSLDEAERRAKICAGCYLNVNVPGCGGLCREVARIVTETKGDRTTRFDTQLRNCAVCKCTNGSQIHFPLAILETADTDTRQNQYPNFCWKQKQSPAYQTDNQ